MGDWFRYDRVVMYKIELYKPSMLKAVAKVMQPLYGTKLEPYVAWRYHQNPYTEKPLSIVALHNGEIVGFRGFLATPWVVGDTKLSIMCVGDTIVAPEHRMKGVSMLMGLAGLKRFKDYDAFINLSTSSNATPGYLKLGFTPLVEKIPYLYGSEAPHYNEPFDNIFESTNLEHGLEDLYLIS